MRLLVLIYLAVLGDTNTLYRHYPFIVRMPRNHDIRIRHIHSSSISLYDTTGYGGPAPLSVSPP